MEMIQHPLVYMWVAFFKNDKSIPQFDFDSGSENLWKGVEDYSKRHQLIKVGFYPIPEYMVPYIQANVTAKTLPAFEMNLNVGATPIVRRRNYIPLRLGGRPDVDYSSEYRRRIVYILGWKKSGESAYMFIDELGNCKMSDDFNFV